jgi:hypothetical protein
VKKDADDEREAAHGIEGMQTIGAAQEVLTPIFTVGVGRWFGSALSGR